MQDVPAPAKTQPDDPTVVDLQELRKELRDKFKKAKAMLPSDAIREEDSDDEIEADVCNIDDKEPEPFEYCMRPIIPSMIGGAETKVPISVKILIDSGLAIDIISGKLARRLRFNTYNFRNCGNQN